MTDWRPYCDDGYEAWHRDEPPVDRHLPRYCTCVAYQRTPDLPWQCDRCYRRIHPRYDYRIGTEKTP